MKIEDKTMNQEQEQEQEQGTWEREQSRDKWERVIGQKGGEEWEIQGTQQQ